MSFVRKASSLALNRIAGAALTIAISAASARMLAPGDLGALVAALAGVTLLMRIASLGLGQAAQYFGAREAAEERGFGRALLVATLPPMLASSALLLAAGPHLGGTVLAGDPVAQDLFHVLQWGIPLALAHFVAALYVLGRREMRRYLGLSLAPLLVSVAVLAWGAWERQGLYAVVWAWMAQFGLSFVLGLLALARRERYPAGPWLPTVLELYRYGLRSFLVATAAFAAGRISLIMGAWFCSGAAVGEFAVGRTFSEALLLIYGAIGALTFSYVGGLSDQAASHAFIGRVCRLSFLVFAGLSLVLAGLAPFGILVLFGDQYGTSFLVVWVLLPGLVFSALQRTLENYLYGRGKQAPMIFVHLVSIVFLVAFGALFAPRWGALGLAAANALSFVGSFLLTAFVAQRADGLDPRRELLPRVEDLRELARYLGDLRTRIRRMPA